MRIGYQGMIGSNAEEAAALLAEKLAEAGKLPKTGKLSEAGQPAETEYVPLITSKGVVDALRAGEIDYGVMASRNSIGGIVEETARALGADAPADQKAPAARKMAPDQKATADSGRTAACGTSFELLAETVLQIHQCLFVKPGIKKEDITCIASHPQALRQTAANRLREFGQITEEELEDTAIAARYLAEGRLPQTTAVLCRRKAGELYKLSLLIENMEDRADNETVFGIYRLKNS